MNFILETIFSSGTFTFSLRQVLYIVSRVVILTAIYLMAKTKRRSIVSLNNLIKLLLSIFIIISIYRIYSLVNVYIRLFDMVLGIFICFYFYKMKANINKIIKIDDKIFNYYHQKDLRWSNIKYRNSTIGKEGCSPTTLAMIHSTINPDITPIDTAKWSVNNKFYLWNGNTDDINMEYAKIMGLNCFYIKRNERDKVIRELKKGNFIVIYRQYTILKFPIINKIHKTNGHIILAYGIDNKNNIIIADPDNFYHKSVPADKLFNKYVIDIPYPFACFEMNI